jgi:hypothetical protein
MTNLETGLEKMSRETLQQAKLDLAEYEQRFLELWKKVANFWTGCNSLSSLLGEPFEDPAGQEIAALYFKRERKAALAAKSVRTRTKVSPPATS